MECRWITEIHGDAVQVKNFIMNHSMRLALFNRFTTLKLLSIADTRFASIIVMLKRFKVIKKALQTMVISEEWTSYREDNIHKASIVKEKILDDEWWDKIAYSIDFTAPICDMIRFCDTDKPCLHLIYEMWDSMIHNVKLSIYKKENRSLSEHSSFYEAVHNICLSLGQKQYSSSLSSTLIAQGFIAIYG